MLLHSCLFTSPPKWKTMYAISPSKEPQEFHLTRHGQYKTVYRGTTFQISSPPIPDSSHSIELGTIPTDNNMAMSTSDSISSSHQIISPLQTTQLHQHNQDSTITVPTQITQPTRSFFEFFAGHSAPLSCAAKQANIDHFSPFHIEIDPIYDILNDDHFENLFKLAHSGLIGAIWSAPPCRLYSSPTQERWWTSSSSIQRFLRRTPIGDSCPATTSSGI